MNKHIIHQAAQLYAESSFKQPLNTLGEPMSIPPGQIVPMGYRKHCKVAEKHFKAGVAWHKEMTSIQPVEDTVKTPKTPKRGFISIISEVFTFNALNR